MSAGALSSKPELNPAITTFFSGLSSRIKEGAASTSFSVWLMVLLIAVAIGLVIWYSKQRTLYENAPNIQSRIQDATDVQSKLYEAKQTSRVHLRDYLAQLKSSGVPESHFALTNFYVSTVNAAGLFFPAQYGVMSPLALRMAILGGARGFVFDIWPDLTPGANFAPVLHVVESGSLWRRITLNSVPLGPMMKALVTEAYEIERPGNTDPLFVYLRFRGKPRRATFDATLAILRATIEPYRLDASFNACRAQDRMFSMPIFSLFNKITVFSNLRPDHPVVDYINVGPKEGVKLEYTPHDVRGMTDEGSISARRMIQQNITFLAPSPDDPAANANAIPLAQAQALGIQCVAMNFGNMNDTLKSYTTMFEKSGFALKPANLRHVIDLLPVPKVPENPGWGSGPNTGAPTVPAAIARPT